MSHGRPTRVAEEIRKLVAQLLLDGVKDPRVGFVSVMGVKMSPDLAYADVFVSLFGTESEKKSSLAGLRRSAGWMRREIGKHLRMRVTPELRFTEDTTLDEAYRLEEKFKEIHAERDGHDDRHA
ncbi:MAG: 30S ribosome-binding factor RbfA [Candidatus Hydrogenedentes bacterium]|nr:30S ribosome-binding factor RbfA [Candidatus Hydrogenedentota bacterium]